MEEIEEKISMEFLQRMKNELHQLEGKLDKAIETKENTQVEVANEKEKKMNEKLPDGYRRILLTEEIFFENSEAGRGLQASQLVPITITVAFPKKQEKPRLLRLIFTNRTKYLLFSWEGMLVWNLGAWVPWEKAWNLYSIRRSSEAIGYVPPNVDSYLRANFFLNYKEWRYHPYSPKKSQNRLNGILANLHICPRG